MLSDGFLLLNRLLFLIIGFVIGVFATTHLHKKVYKKYTDEIANQYNSIIASYKNKQVGEKDERNI